MKQLAEHQAADIDEEQERLKNETNALRSAVALLNDENNNGENHDQVSSRCVEIEDVVADVSAAVPFEAEEVLASENLRRCLDLNLEYQASVRSYIAKLQEVKLRIQSRIDVVESEIAAVKDDKDLQRFIPVAKRSISFPIVLAFFRRPYLKKVYGLETLHFVNEDVKTQSKLGHHWDQKHLTKTYWSLETMAEKDRLLQEIRRECLSLYMEPYIKYRDELFEILQSGDLEGEAEIRCRKDLAEARKQLKDATQRARREDFLSKQELIDRCDWMKIAKQLGNNVNYMSARLCFENYLSPKVNKSSFSKEETESLMEIAEANGLRGWKRIADELGTNRTAYQCLQRYQSKTAKPFSKLTDSFVWHPAEEQRLLDVVASLNIDANNDAAFDSIDWTFVSQQVGQHSWRDCSIKYRELTRKIIQGAWSPDELVKLSHAIHMYGENWLAVSNFIKTRSPKQCARRWKTVNEMVEFRNRQKNGELVEWTPEEDTILWFNRHSPFPYMRQYTQIRRLLPHRSLGEMNWRYTLLSKWHRHASRLAKYDDAVLSLVVKADIELASEELDKLRSNLKQMNTSSANDSILTVNQDGASFAEEAELGQMISALALESNLSQSLVQDKIQMIRDVAALRIAPVPFKRSTLPNDAALRKIKQLLEKKQALTDGEGQDEFTEILDALDASRADPETADKAKELQEKLKSLKGKDLKVRSLIKITNDIHSLLRKSLVPQARTRVYSTDWLDYKLSTGVFFKTDTVYRREEPREYYLDLIPTLKPTEAIALSKQCARLVIEALGSDVEGLAGEVKRKMDSGEEYAEGSEDESANTQQDERAAKLETFYAKIASETLASDVDDDSTASNSFKSLRDEFSHFAHVSAIDFEAGDAAPALPPCQATTLGYRILSMSRLRLFDSFLENCPDPSQREFLKRRVIELKNSPPEAYALLQRRMEMLFAWPALFAVKAPEQPWVNFRKMSQKEPSTTCSELLAEDENLDDGPLDSREELVKNLETHLKNSTLNTSVCEPVVSETPQEVVDSTVTELPPPSSPPPSVRITRLSTTGKVAPHLEKFLKEQRLQEAMKCPQRQQRAEFQLKNMIPLVPMVPLEQFPFPDSRIPNVPPSYQNKDISSRAYALAIAEQAVSRYVNMGKGVEKRPTNSVGLSRRNRQNTTKESAVSPSAQHPPNKRIKRSDSEAITTTDDTETPEGPQLRRSVRRTVSCTNPTLKRLQKSAKPSDLLPPTAIINSNPGNVSAEDDQETPTFAYVQLNKKDVDRLFASGASTVAIAIALPRKSDEGSLDRTPKKL